MIVPGKMEVVKGYDDWTDWRDRAPDWSAQWGFYIQRKRFEECQRQQGWQEREEQRIKRSKRKGRIRSSNLTMDGVERVAKKKETKEEKEEKVREKEAKQL